MKETKEWYDGYHFGNTDVYCPWDVVNHVDCLLEDPDTEPQSFYHGIAFCKKKCKVIVERR